MSGFGGGAVQIGAPPLLVFWLGGENNAATVRANIMVYFIMQGALTFAFYLYNGLFNAQVIALAIMIGVPFTWRWRPALIGFTAPATGSTAAWLM